MNGRTVDGGGVAQEGDRVGERDLELLQQELRECVTKTDSPAALKWLMKQS